jgi:hypothetical protein
MGCICTLSRPNQGGHDDPQVSIRLLPAKRLTSPTKKAAGRMPKMVSMRLRHVTKGAVTCVTELATAAQDLASNRLALLAFRGG